MGDPGVRQCEERVDRIGPAAELPHRLRFVGANDNRRVGRRLGYTGRVSGSLDHLLPAPLVKELITSSSSELAKEYRYTLLLLIELSGPDSELHEPLERLARAKPRRRARAPHDPVTTLQVPVFSNREGGHDADRTELLAQLESKMWFVLPLLKRSSQGEADRITVGRADDNDVVLQESSVSKYHAHFETHEDGSLALTDLRSKNGTRVNGLSLVAGAGRWVQPMDHLQFGKVPTFTCIPSVLRSVLRATGRGVGAGDE
jgi:hypothetical protein